MMDESPALRRTIRTLAARVNDLDQRVRSQARASQAQSRSVEGGSSYIYDEDGELRAVVGILDDGTYGITTYGGDVPPAPSAPLVSPFPGGVTLTWDGFDENDEQGWPDNFARVTFHVSTVPGDDDQDMETQVGSTSSPDGHSLSIAQPSDVTTYCTLVAWTTSGERSEASVEVEVVGGADVAGVPDYPPATAPTIVVSETAEALVVGTGAVELSSWIEYHISTVDGFDPGPTTLAVTSRASVVNLFTLSNGTRLSEGVDYYVVAVPVNERGPGPASEQVTARLDPTRVASIAYAEVTAGIVMAGRLELGQSYWDPDEGLVIPQPGGRVIRLPSDGTEALLDAYVIARGLTVTDDAAFMQLVQFFGTVRMPNGVTDPSGPPGLSFTWRNITSPHLATGDFGIDYRGLVQSPNGTTIASAYWFFGGKIRRASVDGQTWFGDIELGNDWNPLGGITRISNSYYVLGLNSTNPAAPVWQIRKLSATDWTETGTITLTGLDPAGRPSIGTDGTELLVAYSFNNGNGIFIERRTTAGVLQGTDVAVHSIGQVIDVSAVSGGFHDYGGPRYVIWPEKRNINGGKAFVYTTGNSTVTQAEFSVAGGTQVRGAWWDGTRFRHLDGAGTIWSYGANPISRPIYARYDWWDGNPAGTGVHETAASPARMDTWPPRTMPVIDGRPAPHAQVTDPSAVDRADIVRVYAGTTAADCRLQATLPVGDKAYTLDTLNTTSAIAPTVSTFGGAATAPGVWESGALAGNGAPLTRLDGAGGFRATKAFQSGDTFVDLVGESTKTFTITFDEPFDTAPKVFAITNQSAFYPNRVSVSATGATLRVNQRSGTNVTATVAVDWWATTT